MNSRVMTKNKRAQIVELLRCAADVSSILQAAYGTGDADGVNPCTDVFLLAREAYGSIPGVIHAEGYYHYPPFCLEAAQRVEDCEWP